MEEYPPHDGVKRDTDGGEEQPIAEDLDGFDLELDEFTERNHWTAVGVEVDHT